MHTILVADDSFDNRYIIGQMLQANGYRIVYAKNGREALESIAAERPALVFMDLSMPEIDGWTATAAIRADAELATLPVIAVTGHVTMEEIQRAHQAGCTDVLTKPFEYDELISKVRALLK
ncbi:MAG: response regulator [Roseiflexaceae bacterium]|nr:response regulator [Roseiflexaceae bacterium]